MEDREGTARIAPSRGGADEGMGGGIEKEVAAGLNAPRLDVPGKLVELPAREAAA